jgi:hypothetical protein
MGRLFTGFDCPRASTLGTRFCGSAHRVVPVGGRRYGDMQDLPGSADVGWY